ncbi:hypothetical protein MMC29_006177 [Sticta canariensis]|nr:hypothetical protein [Sticta canariensis]
MTPLQALFYVFLLSGTAFGAVNGPCSADGTPGVCVSTATCSDSAGSSHSGFCPDDPADIKCCTKTDCGSGGNCRWISQCSGSSQAGLCPGPADFKCCLDGGSPSDGGGGATSTSHGLSANGVKFIESFEGWNANFYQDSAGVKTIGYGHACQPASACDSIQAPISRETGDDLLHQDAAGFVSCVNRYITVAVRNPSSLTPRFFKKLPANPSHHFPPQQLTQNQFDALVSFAYNLGCGNLQNLAANLNAHEFAKATDQMKQYVRAGGVVVDGLVKRRQAEVDLFNS